MANKIIVKNYLALKKSTSAIKNKNKSSLIKKTQSTTRNQEHQWPNIFMAKPDLIFSYQPNKITTKKNTTAARTFGQPRPPIQQNPEPQSRKTQKNEIIRVKRRWCVKKWKATLHGFIILEEVCWIRTMKGGEHVSAFMKDWKIQTPPPLATRILASTPCGHH